MGQETVQEEGLMPTEMQNLAVSLRLTIDAVSRINVALQGQFLGGIAEAQAIGHQLRDATDLLREIPDA